MSQFSDFGAISGVPFGDKVRVAVTTVTFGSEATILNVASGGAIITGIKLECPDQMASTSADASLIVDNLKVTIDGAAERTLTYGLRVFSGGIYQLSAVGERVHLSPWADIGYRGAAATSHVIKLNTTADNLTETTGKVVVEYVIL